MYSSARRASYVVREALSSPVTRRAAVRDLTATGRVLDADVHLVATVDWLCRAQDMSPGGGVSYGYDLRNRWQPPYPETTGYIVSTLLDCADASEACGRTAHELRGRAARLTDWLIGVQMPCGAISAGTVVRAKHPTVFNTGQVLDGWCRAWEVFQDVRTRDAMHRAADWMQSVQDADGCWRQGLSPLTPNTPATYNVRAAAALLRAGELLDRPDWRAAAVRNADWVLTQQRANGWFENNCVSDNTRPLTHTIGYTLEGLLAIAARSGIDRFVDAVVRATDAMLPHVSSDGFLSGQFDEAWRPAATWSCLTGASQLAMVWYRLSRLTAVARYADYGRRVLDFVKRTQRVAGGNPAVRGGIKGSQPVWGSYERFRYPNWAAKFFADALLAARDAGVGEGERAEPARSAAGLRLGYMVEDYPTFVVSEIQQLRHLGSDVSVFAAFRPRPESDPEKEAVRSESIYFPESPARIIASNVVAAARAPFAYFSAIQTLIRERESLRLLLLGACHSRIVRKRRIDHLHAEYGTRTTTLAYVTARLSGIGFSFTTHAHDVFRSNPSLAWKTDEAVFMRTISQFNRAFIERTYQDVDATKVHVVYLGVDARRITPRSGNGRAGGLRLVAVGDLLEQKGYMVLVDSCARLAARDVPFDCRIVGEGPLRSRLEQRIQEHGLGGRVHLLGAKTHAEALMELSHADVFVLPCIDMRGRGEHVDGIPVALMEAMACGLPVVTTDLSGMPEVIDSDDTGVLIAPDDAGALARALLRLCADPERCAAIGHAARATVLARFDLERNTARLACRMRAAAAPQ